MWGPKAILCAKGMQSLFLAKVSFVQYALLSASLTDCAWSSAEGCFNTGEQRRNYSLSFAFPCSLFKIMFLHERELNFVWKNLAKSQHQEPPPPPSPVTKISMLKLTFPERASLVLVSQQSMMCSFFCTLHSYMTSSLYLGCAKQLVEECMKNVIDQGFIDAARL